MAAKTRSELLDVTEREFEKLDTLVGPLEADIAMDKGAEETSIKDVIAHRAHWIDLFLGWYADGLAGRTVHFPAEGYKWSDLGRYNADLRARQSGMDWPAALAMLRNRHNRLLAFLRARSEAEMYGGPMRGANNAWTPGRWAEAAGPSHYRSASKYVRARLRQRKEGQGAGQIRNAD